MNMVNKDRHIHCITVTIETSQATFVKPKMIWQL